MGGAVEQACGASRSERAPAIRRRRAGSGNRNRRSRPGCSGPHARTAGHPERAARSAGTLGPPAASFERLTGDAPRSRAERVPCDGSGCAAMEPAPRAFAIQSICIRASRMTRDHFVTSARMKS